MTNNILCAILVNMTKISPDTYKILRASPSPESAEKDYLECLILDQLFNNQHICENYYFAGGASLSKSYQLGTRIGQDVDLVCANYDDIPDVHSRKQLEKFKRSFKNFVFTGLREQLNSIINTDRKFMILTDREWHELKNTENFMSSPTLHLLYKSEFSTAFGHMKLEIIPRHYDINSINYRSVIPYSIKQPIGYIPTVRYEQTFWDKVYALHTNANTQKPKWSKFYSRHYYDVAKISRHVNMPTTLLMLSAIEQHQQKYTMRDIAPLSSIKDINLLPDNATLSKLGTDYDSMANNFLGAREQWSDIVATLRALNTQIKTL